MTRLTTEVCGRHASSESKIIVRDETGKTELVNNLSTRIDPATTSVTVMSAYAGTVCLRVEDDKHADFWMEFNLDVRALDYLLAQAKGSMALHD